MTATSERQSTAGAGTETGIRVIQQDQRTTHTSQTTGMKRQELLSEPGAWIGVARTPAGSTSGWHHHGDYLTYLYILEGRARFDFGPGGRSSCEAGPGDLVVVSRGEVHREANIGDSENALLVTRIGSGEPNYNVDAPAEA